jgi:hypothetical protein
MASVGGTNTAAGYVPHLNYRGLRCPVRLATVRTERGAVLVTTWGSLPQPVRRRGCYLFALPGGGTIEGPIR